MLEQKGNPRAFNLDKYRKPQEDTKKYNNHEKGRNILSYAKITPEIFMIAVMVKFYFVIFYYVL